MDLILFIATVVISLSIGIPVGMFIERLNTIKNIHIHPTVINGNDQRPLELSWINDRHAGQEVNLARG